MNTVNKGITLIFMLLSIIGIAQTNSKENKELLPEFKHSISVCPAAIAFGIYSINYEYLHNQKHGLVVRFDYEDIPKNYTDAKIESKGYSFILNYRYHFNKSMKSYFVGAYGRYRQFEGKGRTMNSNFEFTMPDYSFGINAGKKWVWKSGFTMTFALGYGFSNESWESTPNTIEVDNYVREYRKDYDFIDPFYGEFSIGYSF